MAMTRWAASPSTTGGRESGWPSGPVMPFGQEFLLQMRDGFAVFGVDVADGAEFQSAGEAVQHDAVIDHQRAFIGHEMLETVDAVLAGQDAHFLAHAVGPGGDSDVKAVIGGGFFRPTAPGLEGIQHGILWPGDHEVDDGGRAAGQARGGAGEKIFGGDGAHEGQLHMGVRVDAAGHDEEAAGIDDFGLGRNFDAGRDLGDEAVDAKDVGAVGGVGRDDGAAANEHGHEWPFGEGSMMRLGGTICKMVSAALVKTLSSS